MTDSRWSTEGVRTVSLIREGNIVNITCSSSHLTSFAVLVDVRGSQVCIASFSSPLLVYNNYLCINFDLQRKVCQWLYVNLLHVGRGSGNEAKVCSYISYIIHLHI